MWVTNSTHIKNICSVQSIDFHIYQYVEPDFPYSSLGHEVSEILCVCPSSDKIIILTVVWILSTFPGAHQIPTLGPNFHIGECILYLEVGRDFLGHKKKALLIIDNNILSEWSQTKYSYEILEQAKLMYTVAWGQWFGVEMRQRGN